MDSKRITQRAESLRTDRHLVEQVERLMEPYLLIRGTADAVTLDELITQAALGVAILEDKLREGDESPSPVYGVIVVAYSPASGYDLLLRGSTVYALHLGRGVTEVKPATWLR